MIIARSPMRISLGGGGTDLPSYYQQFGGFFISAAIDKYMYVLVHQSWSNEYVIKYSQLERALTVKDIKHPIVRSALDMMKLGPNLEIASMADIPAGTGLGSSGSFTTALLLGLHAYQKNLLVSPHDLAEQACDIEINWCKEPIGKQDQYIAAYGGITCFDVAKDGTVNAYPANLSPVTIYTLEDNLAIFFTGLSRSGAEVLKDQDDKSKNADSEMLENLHYIKDLGQRSKTALEAGQLYEFGELMHEHWERKRKRTSGMTNTNIDNLYKLGREAGAVGGKLMGAGGGGFLIFYTEKKQQLREAMANAGAQELRFRFDFEGTKLIV
jgi:D-glycero-alpha-D-manno-heptose-7-phosphate kinase